jgi:hypothetical protein
MSSSKFLCTDFCVMTLAAPTRIFNLRVGGRRLSNFYLSAFNRLKYPACIIKCFRKMIVNFQVCLYTDNPQPNTEVSHTGSCCTANFNPSFPFRRKNQPNPSIGALYCTSSRPIRCLTIKVKHSRKIISLAAYYTQLIRSHLHK